MNDEGHGPNTDEKPISEWSKGDPDNGLFGKFLVNYYFPVFVHRPKAICLLWLITFIICVVYGPSFLSKTRSNLDVPKGTPSADAIQVFQDSYPGTSTWPPALVVQYTNSPGKHVVGNFTKALSASLANFASSHSSTISSVSGYWELIKIQGLTLLANKAISPDNQTMVSTLSFKASAARNDIDKTVIDLLKFTSDHNSADVTVQATGLFPLFSEMQTATAESFGLIDGTVIPVCILVLGFQLRSYRHMLICICCLGCSLLLAFAILVPITDPIAINPFAPSIMMSLGIAICFDYTLFMISRFQEELSKGATKEDAVFAALVSSGHVICLSGTTLMFTFLLLLAFPQAFLNSVGYGCAVCVFSAIVCNMSLTPALLMSFDCFLLFELYPTRHSICCYHNPPPTNVQVVAVQEKGSGDPESKAGDQNVTSSYVVLQKQDTTESVGGTGSTSLIRKPETQGGQDQNKNSRSLWFIISYTVTEHALIVLLVAAGITIPFFIRFMGLIPTSDNNLIYLLDSPSLTALNKMEKSFNPGSLDPYNVILTTGKASGVLSQTYFSTENKLVHRLINEEGPYMNAKSITSLSYFYEKDITYSTYLDYTTVGTVLYSSSTATAYRALVLSKMNTDKSASMVTIETTVPPNSQVDVGFINEVRAMLIQQSAQSSQSGLPVRMYLIGAYTTTLDVQNALYGLIPAMIGATCAVALLIVGFSFGSIGLAFRLGLTSFMSLSWTYGLMVMVYQPGDAQNAFAVLTPSLNHSSGLYWIIPIMSFSILVGLALDYDIFLMSRVVEFRRMGWSDRAAVCLAIEKTGSIITAAGLIMSISFAGLLIPKAIVLNQYGFSLFIGVAFDTFLVRTFLVPAVVTAFGKFEYSAINWFPTKMPPVLLSREEEDAALWAGCWSPDEAKSASDKAINN